MSAKESKVKSLSCVRLFAAPWTVAYHAPLSVGFSRQEYWSGLPFPSPEDLPNPGIEPGSPHIVGRRFTIWATRQVVTHTRREGIKPGHDYQEAGDIGGHLRSCLPEWAGRYSMFIYMLASLLLQLYSILKQKCRN